MSNWTVIIKNVKKFIQVLSIYADKKKAILFSFLKNKENSAVFLSGDIHRCYFFDMTMRFLRERGIIKQLQ